MFRAALLVWSSVFSPLCCRKLFDDTNTTTFWGGSAYDCGTSCLYLISLNTHSDDPIAVLYLTSVVFTRVRNTGNRSGESPDVTRRPPFCPFVPQAGMIRSSDNFLVTVSIRSREQ